MRGALILAALLLAAPAAAQVRGVQFGPRGELSAWDMAGDRLCLSGVVRGTMAAVALVSPDSACAYRIGIAERLGNVQAGDHGPLRLWRLTFDAGGVLMLWVREPEDSGRWMEALLEDPSAEAIDASIATCWASGMDWLWEADGTMRCTPPGSL